jgi:hypothetical protein
MYINEHHEAVYDEDLVDPFEDMDPTQEDIDGFRAAKNS